MSEPTTYVGMDVLRKSIMVALLTPRSEEPVEWTPLLPLRQQPQMWPPRQFPIPPRPLPQRAQPPFRP